MSGDKPTVISTFAGTGGSSLGYHWAGFKELLAIEWEDHAVECFKLNFPSVPVWQRDITTVTSEEILDFCNLKAGRLDVFDGSPPCQGFSTAGKRNVNDSRNTLFESYIRLIIGLQPKVFVMENVTGMVKGDMKGKFIEILKSLKALDYNVSCKKMNSKYYGVPQSRERLIFIGVRKSLEINPVFPIPSNKMIGTLTAIEKIKDIGETQQIPACILPFVKRMKPGETAAKYHPKGNYFGHSRLPAFKPCGAILKSSNTLLHPTHDRNIGLNEAKALCSFPIDWILPGEYSAGIARLGNAVMPKFMQAIAQTIKKEILEKAIKCV